MCGFTGFWDQRGTNAPPAAIRAMCDALAHRGPDDSGAWADEAAGVVLGHRRLSIIDLSAEGHQPMHSACGRWVVVFNGEIYNFPSIRDELAAKGHTFRGHSDTEVLLAAVREWGVSAAVQRFNGMFAFALWDRRERRLHLARDRMGEKPVYYGRVGSSFVFGSELKALRAHPEWAGEVDRGALALYLRYNYVPAPYSIYRGIRKLPPATILTVGEEDGGEPPAPVAYWCAGEKAEEGARNPFAGSDAEAADALDGVLRDAVRRQMVADVPLGAFLSGGVDSSAIVALMQAQSARPVRTFTIGFREKGFDEAEHARAVAGHLGTDHTELYVTPHEALDVIPALPSMYDEPFADSSQIPTFLVSRLARGHVTVSLSGDGGDELFGGYNRYFVTPRLWSRIRWIPGGARRGVARALASVEPERWNRAGERISPVLPGRLRHKHLGQKVGKLAGVLGAPDADAIFQGLVANGSPLSSAVLGETAHPVLLTDRDRWPDVPDFASRMMYLDAMTYLPDDILVKVDRAAMAVSLETRVPFLDHQVVEFAWKLGIGVKVRDGQGKWLLRQVLYRYVPRALIERPKQGFAVPVAAWLRGPLRDWAEEILDERRLRREGFLEPAVVRRMWEEHLSGKRDWHSALWAVLMFGAWLQEAEAPAACTV